MKRINFYLPEVQVEDLDKLRHMTGVSASEHVRRALTQYTEKELTNATLKQGRKRARKKPLAKAGT